VFDTQDLSPKLGESGLDNARDCLNGLDGIVAFVRERAPHLKVYHFLGGRHIHSQYFPDGGDLVGRWERGDGDWPSFLGTEAGSLWSSWRRDPAELNAAEGLTTVLAYQGDDHAIFDEYSQNPRSMFYHDLEASAAKAALVDTRAALVWNTFFEGYIGLNPANWWYQKVWVAPDFNPASPLALAGWAGAMRHRDRDLLLCGSWNRKGGGHEAALRRWAKAFRSLPPTEMRDVVVGGSSPALVRAAAWKERTHVAVLNPTPFPCEVHVTLGGVPRSVTLAPFALDALAVDGTGEVAATGETTPAYVQWVTGRLTEYEALLRDVRALDAAAAPAAFDRHLAQARTLADARKWLDADVALGHGLTAELTLRKRVLAPPVQRVPRLGAAPVRSGDLAAWPAEAADLQSTDANIGTHLFFTSQWEGLDDLSARVRFGHDGTKLHIGIAVRDDTLAAKDGLSLCLSPAAYRQWLPQSVKYEHRLDMRLPLQGEAVEGQGQFGFVYTSRRVSGGYVVEGSIELEALGLKSGSRIGWVFQVSDDDNTPHLANDTWARKSALLIPNDPTFAYWDDARTCGEWVIE